MGKWAWELLLPVVVMTVAYTTELIAFEYFYLWKILLVYRNSEIFPYVLGLLGFGLWSLSYWSYLRCAFSDPGFVNSAFEVVASSKGLVTVGNSDERLGYTPGRLQFCSRCKMKRPERAHHCDTCHRCVMRMDHHCQFIGNCVGFWNLKYFILWCFWTTIVAFYFFACFTPFAGDWIQNRFNCDKSNNSELYSFQLTKDNPCNTADPKCNANSFINYTGDDSTGTVVTGGIVHGYDKRTFLEHKKDENEIQLCRSFPSIIEAAWATYIAIFVSMLLFLCMNLSNALSNVTEIEHLYHKRYNPYNVGCIRNLEQVFGKISLSWLLPIIPRHIVCDGLSYPTRCTEEQESLLHSPTV